MTSVGTGCNKPQQAKSQVMMEEALKSKGQELARSMTTTRPNTKHHVTTEEALTIDTKS